jgi:hypothetical protein
MLRHLLPGVHRGPCPTTLRSRSAVSRDRSPPPLATPAVLVDPTADLGRVEADVVAPLDVGDALFGDEPLDVPRVDAEQRGKALDVQQRRRRVVGSLAMSVSATVVSFMSTVSSH